MHQRRSTVAHVAPRRGNRREETAEKREIYEYIYILQTSQTRTGESEQRWLREEVNQSFCRHFPIQSCSQSFLQSFNQSNTFKYYVFLSHDSSVSKLPPWSGRELSGNYVHVRVHILYISCLDILLADVCYEAMLHAWVVVANPFEMVVTNCCWLPVQIDLCTSMLLSQGCKKSIAMAPPRFSNAQVRYSNVLCTSFKTVCWYQLYVWLQYPSIHPPFVESLTPSINRFGTYLLSKPNNYILYAVSWQNHTFFFTPSFTLTLTQSILNHSHFVTHMLFPFWPPSSDKRPFNRNPQPLCYCTLCSTLPSTLQYSFSLFLLKSL